ncbi:hypothetical protein B4N84_27500 [Flavobacterium sp. IR1]|nr:hypothetical protein B4N84_27500 [Flavobacterium sp. IR1]
MKKVIYVLILVSFLSCAKRDKINHYLIKKVTVKELLNNGFYKYSYNDTVDDLDKVDDTIKYVVKYDMYSNVKPEKNENGEICPKQLIGFDDLDSVRKKEINNYRKDVLNDRIITYVFRNDLLFYKNLVVYSIDKSQKKTADLTSKNKILKYYDSLKIPIKPIYYNNDVNAPYPKQFEIDKYRAFIDYGDDEQYEMSVNYITNSTYRNILEEWYAGKIHVVRYYL